MTLPPEDLLLFYKLHQALMFFVNQRLKVLDEPLAGPDDFANQPPKESLKVRDALVDHRELIDAFVAENPLGLPEEELEIVRSWNDLVAAEFYVLRNLKKHTIFLTTKEPILAYGVVALMNSFEELLGSRLPHLCKAVLLPFKGQIVHDGILAGYNITIGSGIRRRLKESYDEAKERYGVITTLPAPPEKPRPAEKKPATKKRTTRTRTTGGDPSIPDSVRPAYDKIVGLIDAICREHLDAEYGALTRKLAGVLARKRPSPLTRGKPESWASGIVRVVGWVNFIDDPSQPNHMRLSDIDKLFGISEATGSAKSMAIRNLLRIRRFDPEWTVPSRMEDNPMAWMIEVNGLLADARRLPREIQEEAFRKGLIPFIPGDRHAEREDGE